jgi:hypothetical protein
MATITGLITINGKEVLEVDADPSAGAGTPSPRASLAMFDSGSVGRLYIKTGTADTAWSEVDTPEGGDWKIDGNTLTGGSPSTPAEFFGSNNDYDVITRRNAVEQFRLQNNAFLIGLIASLGGRLQIGETVADASVLAEIFDPTSNPIIKVSRMSRLATTTATPATQTFLTPTNTNTLIEVRTCVRQTGGGTGAAGDGASYIRTCHARNLADVVTIFANQTDYTYEVTGAMNFALSSVGDAFVTATATGTAGRNLSWGLHANLLITAT